MRSFVLAVVLVAGCTPMPAPSDSPPAVAGCAAGAAAALVGRAYDEALLADAKRLTGASTVRVIRPGDMVTKDFRQDRLNLNFDDKGAVASVNCG